MVTKLGTAGNDVLTGTDGDDTLQGLAGDDQLTGGKGADFLDGGIGIDTAHYDHASAGVGVNLVGEGFFGEADHDTFSGVENVTGSAFNDNLFGDSGANRLSGGAGTDVILGGGDSDVLDGGAGNDNLFGEAGDDTLNGGPGADLLDGGAGGDIADYSSAAAAVGVDLAQSNGFSGEADGDRYNSIENVAGSAFADSIRGVDSAVANILHGNGGNDIIRAGEGDDSVFGDAGNDLINGGRGADHLDGGAGIDTVNYQDSPAAVTVSLNAMVVVAAGGDAEGDTITGFENIVGSNFGDFLTGSNGANMLHGGLGADSLFGLGGNDVIVGGAGADNLNGGYGTDTLDYSQPAVGLDVSLTGSQALGGDAQGDTMAGFENLTGSGFADGLSGDGNANKLSGGGGNDLLFGGLGRDELSGGAGADRFNFFHTTESGKTATTRDVVHDFHHGEGDKLVLDIDGNTGRTGFQALSFIGTHAFTAAGQVREFLEGDHTVVEANTSGTSGAEMQLQLDHHLSLVTSDFIFAA
jgi:Ca2+-binding RTX toxin-like protein